MTKTYKDDTGHWRFKSSDELVHRHNAEKHILHRKLYPWEVIHHKDGDINNNHQGNLQVMTFVQHWIHHIKHSLKEGKLHPFTVRVIAEIIISVIFIYYLFKVIL
ncbi:hypothetical protein ACFLQI_01645 [Candidatus Undinarchaeota archaeon]